MKLFFTKDVIKQLQRIPKKDMMRIMKKLNRFCDQENPLVFARKLVNSDLGMYKWRIGARRVVFDIDETGITIIVLLVGKRKDID